MSLERGGGPGAGTELTDAAVELAILGALVVVLGVFAGIPGIVGGILVAAFWYAFGVPFALAGGHAVLVFVFPGAIDLTTLVVVEVVFAALLLSSVLESPDPPQFGALTVGILAGLVLLVGGTVVFFPVWVGAIVLLAVVAVLGYGIHRYERALWDVRDVADGETHEHDNGGIL
ncbi:hypothetical protein OB955_19530 [Halobacteria archaeon AArc-m2/3/4]|uniref:DUF8163 domain-containing protein n=1 Tax=Natronoglomus mannanivorans TaxID=2979990 RepID=A0AAP2Z1Q3_9EURY|nr:hypothetical protein [Halobacteria archaeon AArc-xg1-1]MCU4974915.1 hypothetical protein [Halobacteria archaeon AArc-m2/3/4]